jgi:hypothetical protein
MLRVTDVAGLSLGAGDRRNSPLIAGYFKKKKKKFNLFSHLIGSTSELEGSGE